MSKKSRRNPTPPAATRSGRELGNRLRTRQQREDAMDIITIRNRRGEPTVSLETVLREHRKRR